MNQKERLEEIRQRHEEERHRRKILIHRVIFALAALIIVLTLIFTIKGCVSGISKRIEEKKEAEIAAMATPTPAVTQIPVIDPNVISEAYYANSAFVGNSFVDGMVIYELVDGADYFSKIGLTVNEAMAVPEKESEKSVIDRLNSDKKYSRIFMMFGENELGWRNPKTFVEQYGAVIDKVKEYQSEAQLYLLAITPITKKVSDENIDSTTNERIVEYNELIAGLAQKKGVIYADIHTAVKNATGELDEDAASDGIHFGKEYYEKCLLYIQNNLQ